MDMDQQISKTIYELRTRKRWTMKELGERVGMSHTGISRRESGEFKRWGSAERERFARVFGLTLEAFDDMCSQMPTTTQPTQQAGNRSALMDSVVAMNEKIDAYHEELVFNVPLSAYAAELEAIAKKYGVKLKGTGKDS